MKTVKDKKKSVIELCVQVLVLLFAFNFFVLVCHNFYMSYPIAVILIRGASRK